MILRIATIFLGFAVTALLLGCSAGSPLPVGADNTGAAAEYCKNNGGAVETRYPFYGTNNTDPLQLAGSLQVCTFTLQADGSRIFVAVDTLYTNQPTLASIA